MKFSVSSIALGAVLASATAPAAVAQAVQDPFFRGRYEAVTDRYQPEYSPESVQAGAFLVDASLGAGMDINDNIYASETGKIDDVIVGVRPRLDARTTWSVHGIRAGFALNHREFLQQDAETATDYSAYLNGRLDVARGFWVSAQGDAARITETRYAPSAVNSAADPTEYDRSGYALAANFSRDRFRLEGRAGAVTDDFSDVARIGGGRLDQDFRDVTDTFLFARAALAVSPAVALFLQARSSELDYDFAGTPADPTRDASRTWVQGGVNFELLGPFAGEIAVGYLEEDKDSAARRDFDGLAVDASLRWFPTELTTVTFSGERTVFDPGLVNSATALASFVGARVDHELRRNVLLFGETRIGTHDFQDIDRKNDLFDLGMGIGYKLNKRAHLELAYQLRNRDSSGVNKDRSFDQNVLSVGVKLYP
jgi:hypothetical protein